MNEPLHLFEGFGIELEYMIVDKETLQIKTIADKVLNEIEEGASEVSLGEIAWSNELVLHVIELKTDGPSKSLAHLPNLFQENVNRINNILEKYNAKLLPTGAHPLMDPDKETFLWQNENNIIYDSYNRIFGCKGHGWSNLQSTHINLPFYNDEEFARLHAAIRLLLPIIPAISASTPIINGKFSGLLDTRLEYYRNNQKKIPSISGLVVPERAFSKSEYEKIILEKIYRDIAKYDPDGILQFEWLNSRGAIARFMRNTIEIRIIDIQESVSADISIAAGVVTILRSLINEKYVSFEEQKKWDEKILSEIFLEFIKAAENTIIDNKDYLKVFGYKGKSCMGKELWRHLIDDVILHDKEAKIFAGELKLINAQGSLSRRILNALESGNKNLLEVYEELSICLQNNVMFGR